MTQETKTLQLFFNKGEKMSFSIKNGKSIIDEPIILSFKQIEELLLDNENLFFYNDEFDISIYIGYKINNINKCIEKYLKAININGLIYSSLKSVKFME